nr:putative reverse transcriptase domain-containing protein [Tanacetum cinerariifolium]
MLKFSPWKGVIRFGKREKFNPRYIGPFKILAKVRTVAYHLKLSEQLSRVHSTFHVSNLKKCLFDETFVISLDEIQIDDKLYLVEEPVEIMDHEVKCLKQSRILIVKEDNDNSIDEMVDDTRKKLVAPPKKTGIRSGRKVDSHKRNVVFSPETKVRYFDKNDIEFDDMGLVVEEVAHGNASSKNG